LLLLSVLAFSASAFVVPPPLTLSKAPGRDHQPLLSTLSADTASLFVAHGTDADSSVAVFLPVLGSSMIMLTIVGLLYLWETCVEWARENVSASLRPVIESILAEISGLGFIGLVLQTVLGGTNSEWLEELNIKLFGEGEILVETFEFLHMSFFQVGVGFFIAGGAMVAVGLSKLKEIETIEELKPDENGACTVRPDKLAAYLPVLDPLDDDKPPTASDPLTLLWNEICMSTEERAGKVLLMRADMIQRFNLPSTFRIERYVECAFSTNLLKTVELSPLTWIYLIPVLALANSVDLSHDVVNVASPNAAESAGFFFTTPRVILPSVFTVVLSIVWGYWNCLKMTQIKYMLLSRLGKDATTGETVVLPPPFENEQLRREFDSSPLPVQTIESIWAKPATSPYEELFGTAGAAGPSLYRNSIKFNAFLSITNIVFFGSQVVSRDVDALLNGLAVGDPSHLTAELITYTSFVLVSLAQLVLVAPRAFWNFCVVNAVQESTAINLLQEQSIPVTKPQPSL
jgi:hypothetical protein